MLTVVLLAIPLDILIYVVVMSTHPTSGLLGNFRLGEQTLAIAGIALSALVFSALMLGLKKDPKKKGGAVLACVVVLAIVLIQAIYFTGAWLKYG